MSSQELSVRCKAVRRFFPSEFHRMEPCYPRLLSRAYDDNKVKTMNDYRMIALIFLASLVSCAGSFGQRKDAEASDKFAIFVVSNADSSAVSKALVRRMNDSKPFVVVSKDDLSKAIVIV